MHLRQQRNPVVSQTTSLLALERGTTSIGLLIDFESAVSEQTRRQRNCRTQFF